jgi:hypothetical protein
MIRIWSRYHVPKSGASAVPDSGANPDGHTRRHIGRAAGIADVPLMVGVVRVYSPKNFQITAVMGNVVAMPEGAWREAQ